MDDDTDIMRRLAATLTDKHSVRLEIMERVRAKYITSDRDDELEKAVDHLIERTLGRERNECGRAHSGETVELRERVGRVNRRTRIGFFEFTLDDTRDVQHFRRKPRDGLQAADRADVLTKLGERQVVPRHPDPISFCWGKGGVDIIPDWR